ncbi:SusC/RagA family TonB-linked outer membrane protein [Chitinophaga sp. Mgbs1]|uniref:SusC/RagA family TonB-linked outer membrane protein n=1 Tax=Chitinophaga solisilvae TaxID=1233460 RepID=A0A9Q5DB89_9BACT|nr:SusC/RagA family TonB-linked outer membrane protein [Chitinophaga solisilvae]
MDMNFTGHQCGRGFPCLNKPRFVLRLIAVIIVVNWLSISATAALQAQGGITLTMRNAALKNVFQEIRKQSKYTFLFNDEVMQVAKLVNIDVKDATIQQVLKQCFLAQPLDYVINGQTIVVTPKKEKKNQIIPVGGGIQLHGKVVDEDGKPLPFATVKIKGANIGALTGADGNFLIRDIDERAVLEVSFLGFESKEIPLSRSILDNDVNILKIVLKRGGGKLDEVQVIAYGETTRRFSTGNVTTVKGADIARQPVSNPLLALQGRVPGLMITQSTGLPGSGVTVRIQGQNSISSGNDPLYVIDGVPYVSQLLPNMNEILGTSAPGGSAGNPLSYLNPADIESIDVLKDADATAIYGSRAANGAILITTRKGRSGKTSVNFSFQQGVGKVPKKLDLLNTSQYLQMRREALKNDGASADPYADYDLVLWDSTKYTDWQKVLIGGTAQYADVQFGLSGGNDNLQYSINANYHRETTVFPGNLADKKYGLSFSMSNTSLNQRFKIRVTGNYQLDNSRLILTDLTRVSISTPPNAPDIYNPDGTLNWAPTTLGNSSWTNPLSYLKQQNKSKTNNLISNAMLSYVVIPGLEMKMNLGYTNMQTNETTLGPLEANEPELRPFLERASLFVNNNINSWIIEPQLTYGKNINKNKFDVLIGTSLQQTNTNGLIQIARGFISDDVMEDMKAAANINISSTTISVYKYNALFARFNYNLDNKYIVNLTARRDGSSRFGPEEQIHNFASVGGAWLFSNESFFKRILGFIDFGKIRGSYGTTGNDQIGDYTFLNRFNSSLSNVINPYQGIPGVLPISLFNPYLQWEETKKLQGGIDLGLLKERILLNVNYYRNRSSNQLLSYSLPITTGFTQILRNFPALVQNYGWEFMVNTVNLKKKEFSWSSSVNITTQRNKLISFPSIEESTYANSLIVGQPITMLKAFHYLGVDPVTGTYQFQDRYGKPVSRPSIPNDQTIIIDPTPGFFGGFQNSIKFKGIEFDFLFQFVKQKARDFSLGYYPGTFFSGNQPVSVLSHWKTPGDIAPVQKLTAGYSLFESFVNATQYSDANWKDASFIRLKNVSLSWRFPEQWLKRYHVESARVFLNGQNIFTITNYLGLDPENKNPFFIATIKSIYCRPKYYLIIS